MKSPHSPARRRVYLILLLVASLCLTLVAVIAPLLQNSLSPVPKQGEIAARDYRAPQAISFTSDVLTQQRRDAVEHTIVPIYTSPDTRIARRQLEQLRAILAYINSVRADSYATSDQKVSDLAALDDVHLRQDTVMSILGLADARWQEVQQEAIVVLERVMSSAIRPENLLDARNRVPALVTLSLPEEQAAIVAELVAAYVAPNSQFSENLTQTAMLEASQAVEPVMRTFVPGQTIALQGEVLGADDVEALQQLGLISSERNWRDLVSAAIISLLLVVFMTFYLRRKQILYDGDVRNLAMVAILFLFFLVGARLIIPTNVLMPYAFPLASFGLVTAALFGTELALVASLPLAILVTFGYPNSLELTFFYLISSLFGVLALGRARRLSTFLWAGLAVAISGSSALWVYRLPSPATNLESLATLTLAAFFNGLASTSISILLHSLLAQFLGMVTPMQLLDLTRPDHPLLRQLLRDASGTYQHSLQVANLAEQAAERIGVDPMVIRAGALYHDVGKISNPVFFIENQPPGFINPHENLDPVDSARIIIRHVPDGLELARRYRLPRCIQEFISEHHGTTLTRYQYYNAVKAAGGDESRVDAEHFRYPGPPPQCRDTALLMLADACEARVRAERPADDESLRNVIKSVVSNRVSSGQLDETRLSLHDLNMIVDSFTATLRGVYHPRLNYPGVELPVAPDLLPLALSAPAETPVDLNQSLKR
jgi:putative nucleotidyltransferase with HDIG domain